MSDVLTLLRRVRVALQQQDYPEAIRCLEEAADLARSLGDISGEGRHLANLALIYYRVGQAQKALDYFELALARARVEHDRMTEGALMGNMGNILRELERHDEALAHLNQALLIAQEVGDLRGRGLWLGNLGLVYDDLKQPERAIELHRQAADVARQLEDQRGLAQRLGNLGSSYAALGDYSNALNHTLQAARLAAEMNDGAGLAGYLSMVARLQQRQGGQASTPEDALDYYELALESYKRALHATEGDARTQAELLRDVGGLLADAAPLGGDPAGDYRRAGECFAAAAGIFGALGMTDARQECEQRQVRVLSQVS